MVSRTDVDQCCSGSLLSLPSLFLALSLSLSLSFGGFGRVSAELITATCPPQQRGHAVAMRRSMLAVSKGLYWDPSRFPWPIQPLELRSESVCHLSAPRILEVSEASHLI